MKTRHALAYIWWAVSFAACEWGILTSDHRLKIIGAITCLFLFLGILMIIYELINAPCIDDEDHDI